MVLAHTHKQTLLHSLQEPSKYLSLPCYSLTLLPCSMRVTASDNGITNSIDIIRPPHGQVSSGCHQAAASMHAGAI